ncbi:hypothetical protein [Burkholderia glumae]|uniref:Uncharacterized protein n=1 Tax=Burkholderia glumae TaxID=337 RepID=A0ABY5BBC1_BURGL|nr:hypothetical protein [Burkholderia glumae]USS44295.1 hypothetical protein NFI99_13500 [Burkholderia glumae]
MIDQRLRESNAYLVDMDRRIDQASRIRDADWFVPACSAVSRVFHDVLPSGITEVRELKTNTLEVLVGAIEQRLKDLSQPSVPAEVTSQVVTALTDRQSREAGEANYLVGWSLAETLGKSDNPASIICDLATLTGESDVRLFGFYDGLAGYLSDASSPLIDAFFSLADFVASNRSRLIPGRFDPMFAATEEAWLKETDLVEVWRGRQWDHFHMYSDELSVVHALSGPQPAAFLAVCDRLQVPPLTELVLTWPAITMDFDAILRLLAAAPTVENQETRSWNRSLVAPVLLEAAFRHLMDLAGTPAQPMAGVEEVSSLARRLAETCLGRPDGRFLVINWSRHLIRLAGARSGEHFDGVFSTTIDVMAEQGVDATAIGQFADIDVREKEEEEKTANEGWNAAKTNSRLAQSFDYFMIAVLVNGSDATHLKVELGSAFQRHLCAKNPALWDYGQERLPNWRHFTVAKLYLQKSDAIGAWDKDWAMLATQRREAVHWSYSNGRDAVHPSLFLANVGIALLEWITADREELRNLAQPMWRKLFESVLPFATHWSLADDKWRSILQALFARYPNAFRAVGGGADVDALWTYLDALGGDDVLFTVAVVHLLLNGVHLSSLTHRDGSDAGVIQRIQAFLDWDASCGGRSVGPQVLAAWRNAVTSMS